MSKASHGPWQLALKIMLLQPWIMNIHEGGSCHPSLRTSTRQNSFKFRRHHGRIEEFRLSCQGPLNEPFCTIMTSEGKMTVTIKSRFIRQGHSRSPKKRKKIASVYAWLNMFCTRHTDVLPSTSEGIDLSLSMLLKRISSRLTNSLNVMFRVSLP